MRRSAKILILGEIIKKFPMSVATMSRKTKKAYLRLCPEKLKKNSGSKGWRKKSKFTNLFNPVLPSAANMRRSAKILILGEIIKKNSYERRDYESEDEKSLS